jgi:hypothetical protein
MFVQHYERDASASLSMLHVFMEVALRGARPLEYIADCQEQQ